MRRASMLIDLVETTKPARHRQTMPEAGQPVSARHAGIRDRMSNCKQNTSTTVVAVLPSVSATSDFVATYHI